MKITRKAVLIGGAALAMAAGGAGVAGAVGGDDGDEKASGPDAARAKAAALRLVPGGVANAVERDSEKGATWEVEVRKPDGSTVDVRLDADLRQVAIDADAERKGDQ
ncbi:MAG: PepSY domain-containing protein [Solirubrobacterales bacterium]|nr:PepSY domain-containing protein [Solirubrobacterales bacterium]